MTATVELDPLRLPATISRGQVARRAQRVVTQLLSQHRYPDASTLPGLIAPLVGTVLAKYPLDKHDRAAAMKISGAAASYCWDFLPDLRHHPVTVRLDDTSAVPPLLWATPTGTVIADVLLTGFHRHPVRVAQRLTADLLEALEPTGVRVDAVRALMVTTPATSLLIRPDETFTATQLSTSEYANLGGVWL